MSWSCPHCEKSFSRKDSMKRHINNRHSNPGHFTPFNAMHYPAERCQRFQLVHPFTCMVAGMTGSGKNCLGTIAVTTSSNRDRSSTGENNLVLLTVAARLYGNASHRTKHRICQGNPHGFRTRCLF